MDRIRFQHDIPVLRSGIAIFANLANCWRLLELTRIDMLIMSYGGLRGAIAFALALILDETKIARKKEFVTATIAVVFFTVFIQVHSTNETSDGHCSLII